MKSKLGRIKCKPLPKIYKYIGYTIAIVFAIYIISKTIQTQRNKNIEGFKKHGVKFIKKSKAGKEGNKNIKEGNKNIKEGNKNIKEGNKNIKEEKRGKQKKNKYEKEDYVEEGEEIDEDEDDEETGLFN